MVFVDVAVAVAVDVAMFAVVAAARRDDVVVFEPRAVRLREDGREVPSSFPVVRPTTRAAASIPPSASTIEM